MYVASVMLKIDPEHQTLGKLSHTNSKYKQKLFNIVMTRVWVCGQILSLVIQMKFVLQYWILFGMMHCKMCVCVCICLYHGVCIKMKDYNVECMCESELVLAVN